MGACCESSLEPDEDETVRDLLRAALRHRPDRIIVGEVRGGEAFDSLDLPQEVTSQGGRRRS